MNCKCCSPGHVRTQTHCIYTQRDSVVEHERLPIYKALWLGTTMQRASRHIKSPTGFSLINIMQHMQHVTNDSFRRLHSKRHQRRREKYKYVEHKKTRQVDTFYAVNNIQCCLDKQTCVVYKVKAMYKNKLTTT